ncbi:serine/threonine-protein kinase haspin [Pelodytes ibericus]
MAGKTRQDGGVLRTYGRLQPVRRLQPQPHWFSPADPKHLFSSSSSLLSSSCEPSSDPDFNPQRSCRKRRVIYKAKKTAENTPGQKRPVAKRRRKAPSYRSRTHQTSESETHREKKENAPPSERNPTSPSDVLATPFRRFVTVRRKAPVRSSSNTRKSVKKKLGNGGARLGSSGGKVEQGEDVVGNGGEQEEDVVGNGGEQGEDEVGNGGEQGEDEVGNGGEQGEDEVGNGGEQGEDKMGEQGEDAVGDGGSKIQVVVPSPDTSCESSGLPLRRKRMFCKDPSNLPSSPADILHYPLQNSPLLSSTPSVGLSAQLQTQGALLRPFSLCEHLEESVIVNCPASEFPSDKHSISLMDTLFKTHLGEAERWRENSLQSSTGAYVGGIELCQVLAAAPDGPFSPELLSPCHSPSVFYVEQDPGQACPMQDNGSVYYISSELYSTIDMEEETVSLNRTADEQCRAPGHSSGGAETQVSLGDTGTLHTLKHLQPFVSLDSESVTKYFQRKKRVSTINHVSPKVVCRPRQQQQEPYDPSNLSQYKVDTSWDLRNMQPIVRLDPNTVPQYFLLKSCVSVVSMETDGSQTGNPHTVARTPDLGDLHVTSKMLNSVAPREIAGTGRKVCISGFSVKRWGNHPKKRSRAPQELSFQERERSGAWLKEDISACNALSSSLLLSSSVLTSSFLNSSAVLNLSLSPDKDPQREHQRWMRLRAALSLHRRKKVDCAGDKTRVLSTPHHASLLPHRSSLFLLSTQSCSDDLSVADKVFMECDQERPITFSNCLSAAQLHLCQKVGEGVYGEVFRTLRGNLHVALKVIPIEGFQKVNGEDQKCFSEILPEIIISKELSLLNDGVENKSSGFIRLHAAHCVQGCYPAELLKAWDIYAEAKGTENDRPDFFSTEQLFMILEFEFGGCDLECMSSKLTSVLVSRSILHQVTAALAVAEEELRFEHRDLHWGNLLIEQCESQTLIVSLNGESIHIPSSGIQVKIIDYTLSRLDKDGLTVFTDLSSDEDLFLGEGDLQFSVYRDMRQENENIWSSYQPHSNVLWLYYLADKLLSAVKYTKKPTSVSHRRELRKIQDFRREVRNFRSATEALHRSRLFQ